MWEGPQRGDLRPYIRETEGGEITGSTAEDIERKVLERPRKYGWRSVFMMVEVEWHVLLALGMRYSEEVI